VADNLRVKEVTVAPGCAGGARAQRFVICYNSEAAERDTAVREKLVGYLRDLIDGSDAWRVRRRDELVGSLKTTPGRYIMSSDLNPYQAEAAIPDSTTCPGGQCVLSFPTVPAGKRLVIESVSAQLGPVADALVLEGSGVAYFVPKSNPNIGVLASQVTVYYDTGTTPTARIFVGNSTQHTSLIVTLVGRLLDI
jgi:hypothetical protein